MVMDVTIQEYEFATPQSLRSTLNLNDHPVEESAESPHKEATSGNPTLSPISRDSSTTTITQSALQQKFDLIKCG